MNKFNMESAKFLSIIIGICFVFIMVIWHAFSYLPDTDSNKNIADVSSNISEKKEVVIETSSLKSNSEVLNQEVGERKEFEVVNVVKSAEKKNLEPLETIYEDTPEKIVKNDNSIEKAFVKAQELRSNNQYVEALSEYQNIISTTDDVKIKAQAYEEIALMYAVLKRYGSALAAAQKSYNLVPTSSREVLLARLYYKTGDIDKATTRVNNVLRRDFIANDK